MNTTATLGLAILVVVVAGGSASSAQTSRPEEGYA